MKTIHGVLFEPRLTSELSPGRVWHSGWNDWMGIGNCITIIEHDKDNQLIRGKYSQDGYIHDWNYEAFGVGWMQEIIEYQYDPTQAGDTDNDI